MIAGTRLGRYTLLGKVAAGGMAEVFLARQDGPQGFTKTVVIKRILQDLGRDPAFVTMFLDEARLAALINHPNVVSIYELGEDAEAGVYFMAMEFIDGCNLKRVIHEGIRSGRPLSPPLCARIIADACAGLDYAHNLFSGDGRPLQIVHRDISPENILVSYSGQVKVVDFGIAKATMIEGRTQTGQLKGKYGYMPPEQLLGQPLDRRGDIWALGVVLYWMLTGVKPFRGESEGEIIQRIVGTEPQPLLERAPSTPTPLAAIVARALTKDRERRYPTARAMQQEIEGWLARTGLVVNTSALGDYMTERFPEKSDQERLLIRSLMTGTAQRGTPSNTDLLKPEPSSLPPLPGLTQPSQIAHAETTTGAQRAAGLSTTAVTRRVRIAFAALAFVAAGAIASTLMLLRPAATTAPRPVPPPAPKEAVSTPPAPAPTPPPPVPTAAPAQIAATSPSPASVTPPGTPTTAPTPTPVAPTPTTSTKHHHTANVAPGQPPGEIAILVSPWANVFVDGQPAGMTPMQPIEASAGTHHVRLVNEPLHVDKEMTVTVHSGQTAQVRAKLGEDE